MYSHIGIPRNCSRNLNPESPYAKDNEIEEKDFKNIKIGGKDLEVIKENHSETSNSNSVIETFRNKRKSNISSSGNNSGDQLNIHNQQEMINEEDEDIENDTTSFRGSKKLDSYHQSLEKEKIDIVQENENFEEFKTALE